MNELQKDETHPAGRSAVAEGPGFAGRYTVAASLLILAAICILLFGGVLFGPGGRVLSNTGTDLQQQHLYWYGFGFSELRQGRLPLWNPHIFSGTAFYGTFQSGLLYPLNWHFLFLPLDRAVNLAIVGHIFLLGAFTFLWLRFRGLGAVAGLTAGALVMLAGPTFLHLYPGHLGPMQAMAWAPLVLLAVDGVLRRGEWRWSVPGMCAVAMQVFAGAPQYVYITALAAGLYAGILWIAAGCRPLAALRLLTIYLGGLALAAVELCAGTDAAAESVRAGGVSRPIAAMLSLPPENLLTFLLPRFFGDMDGQAYWGRGYLWEMCLFVGVTGLLLALYGAARGERRESRVAVAVILVMLVVALGAYTPLFDLLYRWLPFFSSFRGASKFAFPALLFIAALAAAGLDRLLRDPPPPRAVAFTLGVAALAAAALGFWLRASECGPAWSALVSSQGGSLDDYLSRALRASPDFAAAARRFAGAQLLLCALTLALLAVLLACARRRPRLRYGVALLALAEMFLFAWDFRPTFPLASIRCDFAARHMAGLGRDDRVLIRPMPNAAMAEGLRDIWGFGPLVNRRYAEFMAFSQGRDPDSASQYLEVRRLSRLHTLLRCRAVITEGDSGYRATDNPDSFPRFLLVGNARVLTARDDLLRALAAPDFDPAREVLLEEPPAPAPAPGGPGGTVELLDEGTDRLLLRVETARPAVLLITDTYARGWRARPLAPGPQTQYQLLPADYVLRGIPLAAGRHLICIEYAPVGFRIGRWISLSALAALLCGVALWRCRASRRSTLAAGCAASVSTGPDGETTAG
jgi:hypothetical protein